LWNFLKKKKKKTIEFTWVKHIYPKFCLFFMRKRKNLSTKQIIGPHTTTIVPSLVQQQHAYNNTMGEFYINFL